MPEQSENVWNLIAPCWLDHIRNRPDAARIRQYLLTDPLLELIGGVEGQSVLDAGCGEGTLARDLAGRGAKVTAVDAASRMVAAAREQSPQQPNVTYLEKSVLDLGPIGPFDVVVSNLVFSILPDHETAFGEVARVLKPRGIAVISINHPAMDGVGEGIVTMPSGAERWSPNRYMTRTQGVTSLGAPVFHRSLSDYLNAAFARGLVLTGFREPVTPEQHSADWDPAWGAYDQIPALALLRFRKSIEKADPVAP